MTAILLTTAERLRRLRLERGLRLADVAILSGLTEAHLSRVEAGRRWPSLPALLALANAYNVDPSFLLEAPRATPRVTLHAANAMWKGDEKNGSGVMSKGGIEIAYTVKSRMTDTRKRREQLSALGSPEELIGMALAGCFSMSLAEQLASSGFPPAWIETGADVSLSSSAEQIHIAEIHLSCAASVDGVDSERFEGLAQLTKRSCVVSRALAAVPVTLDATLVHPDEAARDVTAVAGGHV